MIEISEPNKYRVMFCGCGRIHFVPNTYFVDIQGKGEQLLHICNNCGSVVLFAVKIQNGNLTPANRVIKNTILDEKAIINIKNIITDTGYKIYMKNGGFADTFKDEIYCNSQTQDTIVDLRRTIREIGDHDKVLAMSRNYIKGIDWSGTKYDSTYN